MLMEYFTAVSTEQWILIVWAICCGVFDLRHRRLPNWLTLGGSTAAIAALLATGQGWMDTPWTSCLIAAVIAAALTVPAYAFGLLGAGDVKMLVAIGLLGGMKSLLITYGFAGLLSGVVTVIWLWIYQWEAWFASRLVHLGITRFSVAAPKGRRLPFGLAAAIGFSIAVLGDPNSLFFL
jgi:prepilin peptidase CpaA